MRLELPRRARATVGLTPLIDVVFILLLFFMLTTQFGRQEALLIRLPASESSSILPPQESLLIELTADGSVSLVGDSGISVSAVAEHPAVIEALNRATPVFIAADDSVQIQSFTQVLDALSVLGLSNLSVKGLR